MRRLLYTGGWIHWRLGLHGRGNFAIEIDQTFGKWRFLEKKKFRWNAGIYYTLHQESISSTFYTRLFCTKVFWAAFLCLQFCFEQSLYKKCTRRMLMKLTPVLLDLPFICLAALLISYKVCHRFRLTKQVAYF